MPCFHLLPHQSPASIFVYTPTSTAPIQVLHLSFFFTYIFPLSLSYLTVVFSFFSPFKFCYLRAGHYSFPCRISGIWYWILERYAILITPRLSPLEFMRTKRSARLSLKGLSLSSVGVRWTEFVRARRLATDITDTTCAHHMRFEDGNFEDFA